jgi:hypothetical protein
MLTGLAAASQIVLRDYQLETVDAILIRRRRVAPLCQSSSRATAA